MSDMETEVAIIGAGPYGLSLAAHLRAYGVEHRTFGIPMDSWLTKMPEGMLLKSHGSASSLYDADDDYTIKRYCEAKGLPYHDHCVPIPLRTFCEYGLAFQQRFVPDLDRRMVTVVRRTPTGYHLMLEDGEEVTARNVVCAAGITHFAYTPPILDGLPPELVTHSSQHHRLDRFQGREVIVIGAGASALDVAVLLHKAGASVRVVTRRSRIPFGSPIPRYRPLWKRIRSPIGGLGPGWRSVLCTEAPLLFHVMPQRFRFDIVRTHYGPLAGWFLRDQVDGISFDMNVNLVSASAKNGHIGIRLRDADGTERNLIADHVIAATGYKVDLRRLTFLGDLTRDVRQIDHTPVLTSRFESSVPGLYFAGVAGANSFGPVLRFACGARFTARRVSAHLTSKRRLPATQPLSMDRRGEAVG